ncbi:hypothetical protein WICPIJ_007896 [Wickerhamomyces pijperi]|uniref:Uncharacterized protein n=1 Tax=Wickerhamomyces pijperi TaxID=599730 RepID=A0A9P8Q1J6_WICPI|nr:hypothetical protein WICPIJ_007896 [Wickerhamomyces pijperi]
MLQPFKQPQPALRQLLLQRSIKPHQTQLISRRPISTTVNSRFPDKNIITLSKNILKGVLAFYLGALTLGLTGYGIASYLIIDETYSPEWPLSSKIYSKLALINQDFFQNDKIATQLLVKCLKSLNPVEGLEQGGQFKLLTLKEFETKDKEWQNTYINMVLRLAIVKFESGQDLTNAKKLLLYVVNLPINAGDLNLKSKGLRYIARISENEGDLKVAESYLLDTLRYNELYKDGIRFAGNGSNLLDLRSSYDQEVYEVLLELGKLYSLEHKTKSIEIFLNLLENFENNESFRAIAETHSSIKPLLRVSIGEILYTKGLIHKAVDWNLHSFNDLVDIQRHSKESFMVLKQALTNLTNLYKELGDEDKSLKFQKINEQLREPVDSGN